MPSNVTNNMLVGGGVKTFVTSEGVYGNFGGGSRGGSTKKILNFLQF